MKCKKSVIFILFLWVNNIQSEWIDFSLFARVTNAGLYRGAVIWPQNTFFIGPGITLWKSVQVRGPNISYQTKNDNNYQFTYGARFFDDNEAFLSFGPHEEDYRNQRKNNLESYFKVQKNFGFKNLFFWSVEVAKEWIDHGALYSEFSFQAPLLWRTALGIRASIAEKQFNQYLYGPSGNSGVGFSALSLQRVFRVLPYQGLLILSGESQWVLQNENKQADFVRDDDQNFLLSATMIWNL